MEGEFGLNSLKDKGKGIKGSKVKDIKGSKVKDISRGIRLRIQGRIKGI